MARGQIDAYVSDFKYSLISIGFVVALQAIRIFHIFYMTLKVQTSHHGNEKKKEQSAPKEGTRTSIIFKINVGYYLEYKALKTL